MPGVIENEKKASDAHEWANAHERAWIPIAENR